MDRTDWSQSFVIASLYRTDLTHIGLTHEEIDALSNLDMLHLTQKLQALYLHVEFLAHLRSAVNELSLEKEDNP